MEWKQFKMTASEKQKAEHLQVVEEALEGRRTGRKFDWAIPMTVLFTAVVLCFLVIAPSLPLQHGEDFDSEQATSSQGLYKKGFVTREDIGEMPDSVLVYGVMRLTEEQLLKLEQWLATGKTVEAMENLGDPIYEFGLIGENEKQYVQVYYSSSHNGWVAYFVDEKRWLEMEKIDLYELVYDVKFNPLNLIGVIAFGLLAFGYMIYVEKKYMKDDEGRRRKSFAKLWHGVVAGSCYLIGYFYIVWAKGAFIPLGYAVALSGLLLAAYLDRGNSEFMYRKHQYSAQVLYLLFFITMFSFVTT